MKKFYVNGVFPSGSVGTTHEVHASTPETALEKIGFGSQYRRCDDGLYRPVEELNELFGWRVTES